MTVAEAIVTRLKSLAAITALVSTRVYTMELPQNGTLPAIRVQRVGESQLMHLRGGVGLYRTRVQVDSVSRKGSGVDHYAQARDIDEAVRGDNGGSALIGYSGTVSGLRISGILAADVRESYDAAELTQFKIMRDLIVWHEG